MYVYVRLAAWVITSTAAAAAVASQVDDVTHIHAHTHWLRVYCVTASSRWLPGRRRRHSVRHSRRSRRHVCWVGAVRTSHTHARASRRSNVNVQRQDVT